MPDEHIYGFESTVVKSRCTEIEMSGGQQSSTIRLPFPSQFKANPTTVEFRGSFRARLVLSYIFALLLGLAVVCLCLLQSARGSPSTCMEYSRAAVHNIHKIEVAGWKFACHSVHESPHSGAVTAYRARGCWSCLNLNNSSPRQPFLLQRDTRYRSRAIVKPFVTPNKFMDGPPCDQSTSRIRRPGHVSNNINIARCDGNSSSIATSTRCHEPAPVHVQRSQWVLSTATVCSREPTSSSRSSAVRLSQIRPRTQRRVFSTHAAHQLESGTNSAAHDRLKVASWSCSTTAGVVQGSGEALSSRSYAFSTGRNTKSPPFRRIQRRNRPAPLLLILEAVERDLRYRPPSPCADKSRAGIYADGRRRRRRLLARYWPPLIVANLAIGGLGLLCGVWALCRVLLYGRNSRRAADADPDGAATALRRSAALDRDGSERASPGVSPETRPEQSQMPESEYRAEQFSAEALAAATGGFVKSSKLGVGSFGAVYRGHLFNGRVVAIKRADLSIVQKMAERPALFEAKLDVMARLHHKHLVNLVGYCNDHDGTDEMMLVYEYMPNRTLSHHLHRKQHPSRTLSTWKVRTRVALQAARGIEYLHTSAMLPTIHGDVKSSNILFDANWSARLSDIGLLDLIFPDLEKDDGGKTCHDQHHGSTKVAGTLGYRDPECYSLQHLTTESDVYSFGIVILELLTGKGAIHRRNDAYVSVVDFAMPSIAARELMVILDPRVRAPTPNESAAIKVMADVSRQCVQVRGRDRPSMTEIIIQLEHAVILCRPRHTALPVFGAQLGSTSAPGSSSAPSKASDELHDSAEDKNLEAGDSGGSIATDVAQPGSIKSVSQVHDILHDIDDLSLEYYSADLPSGSCYASETDDNLVFAFAGPSNVEDGSSFLLARAAASYGGQRSQSPSWEQLQKSWRRPRPNPTAEPANVAGASGTFAVNPDAAEVRQEDNGYMYCLSDPLLHEGSTLAGFANFGGLGPAEDVDPRPEDHPQLVESRFPVPRGRRRQLGHLREPGPLPAVGEGRRQSSPEGSAENHYIDDIDIEAFLDEYSAARDGPASYAGFSAVQDLEELMRTLLALQHAHEQDSQQQ